MRCLFVEPVFGMSGDMLLSALIDLGADKSVIEREIEKLIGVKILIEVLEQKSKGFTGKGIKIFFEEKGSRDLAQVKRIIDGSGLSDFVKEKSLLCFETLAEVEGKIHGVPKEKVHFHELSAIDTIADIVGFFLAVEMLKIDKIYVSKIPLGNGNILTSHGIIPNPAWATLELLKGFSLYFLDIDKENVTPTSAVLLKCSAENNDLKGFRLERVGYGVGKYKFKNYPNIVRLSLGILDDEVLQDEVIAIVFNVDDITAEQLGFFAEKAIKEGALDVFFTPIFMKKGRPAYEVTLLVFPFNFKKILDIIFLETTTLGVRYGRVNRFLLERENRKVKTTFGDVTLKESRYGNLRRFKIEYEDLRKIALRKGLSFQEVRELITKELEKNK